MTFSTIYDLFFGFGDTSSRHSLREAVLNHLRHKHDTDDIHIQEITRDPSYKPRAFIYPEHYAVNVTYVAGREVCTQYARVMERNGTLDPQYIELTNYKSK
jgi:hypothetical protein